jgi:hypothetical protein
MLLMHYAHVWYYYVVVARCTIPVALPLLTKELQNLMDLYHANISDFFSTIMPNAPWLFWPCSHSQVPLTCQTPLPQTHWQF